MKKLLKMQNTNKIYLKIVSFNCRSLKKSLVEIQELCDTHDIVLLQEHWLLPFELSMLNTIHSSYVANGQSAVNLSDDVLSGRPYGGTAILYRKNLASYCKPFVIESDRMSAVMLGKKRLLLNVYMPTNYNDDESMEEYQICCGKIKSLLTDSSIEEILIAGDFNAQPGTHNYVILSEMFCEYKLNIVDMMLLANDTVTYVSDDAKRMSWIDHIVCGENVFKQVNNVHVLYNFICSDHKPLSFQMECDFDKQDNSTAADDGMKKASGNPKLLWKKCKLACLNTYRSVCDTVLTNLALSDEVINCKNSDCKCETHKGLLDKYYSELTGVIKDVCAQCIPSVNACKCDYAVPGWDEGVNELHKHARDAFLKWVQCGKPRGGREFELMNSTRRIFKSSLNACKARSAQIHADRLAESLIADQSGIEFWREINKSNKQGHGASLQTVGGTTGDANISNMWRDVYSGLYNSINVIEAHEEYLEVTRSVQTELTQFTVEEISEVVLKLKKDKACGQDGVYSEAIIYGGDSLKLRLCEFFNACLTHRYLPALMMECIFIPLPKCKHGDLSDINNYRAIAISSCISKLLECAILKRLEMYTSDADAYQFGFKKCSSTTLCTHVLKEVIKCYREKGSHVFACYLDISKAFDKVNYWKLFHQMLKTGMPKNIVQLLAFWYSEQTIRVRWNNVISDPFKVSNGTRQGSCLSPFLFSFYISGIIQKVTNLNVGCHIRGFCYNMLAYADDMVLLAPSWKALQMMIDVCVNLVKELDLFFNSKKSVCMVFNPIDKHFVVKHSFPLFYLDGASLKFVNKVKYLGHIINDSGNDDDDIARETSNLFFRANMLSRKFGHCSFDVKVLLFRTYCTCFYGTSLWINCSVGVMKKYKSAYIRCMKLMFGHSKYYSTTQILLETGLPSIDTVLNNLKCSFKRGLALSTSVSKLLQFLHMVL